MTRPTSRRWLARAALCIGLGFVTTVAVAWALAALAPTPARSRTELLDGGVQWLLCEEHTQWGASRRWWVPLELTDGMVLRSLWDESAIVSDAPCLNRGWGELPEGPDGSSGCEDARGWPALCLWCRLYAAGAAVPIEWVHGGIQASPATTAAASAVVLPLQPIWSGLLINIVVYALAWGVLLFALGWVRRARRRANGRCTGCGYDRAGLAPHAACPECGVTSPATPPLRP